MNLNEITVFTRVVEANSFTEAASQLGLPKSTVSRSVARLEENLGVRLLQRTTRKLRLTDVGAAYYQRVKQALEAIDEANIAVTRLHEAPSGVLRVTAPYDVGNEFLAGMVARFVTRYPSIHVEVQLTGRTVNLVEEGFDIALRAGHLPDSSLVARKLSDTESHMFAAPAYLNKRGTPVALDDLRDHDCVLFRPRNGRSRWRLVGAAGTETVEVSGLTGGDEFSYVRKAVLAGAGIGLIPWFQCARDVAEGRLRRILPDYKQRIGAFYLVYPSTSHLPRKVAVFRDFIIASLDPAPWSVDE